MIQHKGERCQMDGSFWSDLRIGSDHLPRSRGSSIDGEKVVGAALPECISPRKGGPGSVGFSLFWGSPFLGLVHEGSCQGLLLRIDRSFEFDLV